MKVFNKNIETVQGDTSTHSAASEIKIKLYMDGTDPNSAFPQPAFIEIALYKDKNAINGQKTRLETKLFEIIDVSQLPSYPTLVQEIVGILITNPDSPLYGATVEDTAE